MAISGSQRVHQLVGAGDSQVFLEDALDRVGQRLQQAHRPHPVRPQANLHAGQQAALDQGHVGEGGEQREGHTHALEHHHDDFDQPVGHQSSPPMRSSACRAPRSSGAAASDSGSRRMLARAHSAALGAAAGRWARRSGCPAARRCQTQAAPPDRRRSVPEAASGRSARRAPSSAGPAPRPRQPARGSDRRPRPRRWRRAFSGSRRPSRFTVVPFFS